MLTYFIRKQKKKEEKSKKILFSNIFIINQNQESEIFEKKKYHNFSQNEY